MSLLCGRLVFSTLEKATLLTLAEIKEMFNGRDKDTLRKTRSEKPEDV